MTGRPSTYTPEIAIEICTRIAAGESLRSICKSDHLPVVSTVMLWAVEDREGFSEHYAKSRRLQAELLADEIFDIADDSTNDYMLRQSKSGEEYESVNPEVIGRSRLRVDTRKWYLSKVLPKVYGDKQHIEHSGEIKSDLSDTELMARIADLESKLKQG